MKNYKNYLYYDEFEVSGATFEAATFAICSCCKANNRAFASATSGASGIYAGSTCLGIFVAAIRNPNASDT